MAPGTNIGAATPVQLGAPGDGRPDPFGSRDRPSPGPSGASAPASAASDVTAARAPADAREAKALNDAVAYIRSLAEMRGRNADWAERAVREAASLPASEALKARVVDFVVDDVPALLKAADGRTVQLAAGSVTLHTAGLAQRAIQPDWRSRLLGVITNPNLALILMMIGIYGLFFEFMNPGALVPGVVGAIALLVGMYALSTLPLTMAGGALLLLGVGLLVAEAFAPSFGVLGIGGAVAFILGAALLVDTDVPDFGLSLPLAGGLALSGLMFSALVLRVAVSTRRRQAMTGSEGLLGAPARVLDWAHGRGHVHLQGERWQAEGPPVLAPGQAVRVARVHGLRVVVVEDDPPRNGLPPNPNQDWSPR
jgi:membrane-bound serine protease (ClpP class)